MIQRRTRKASRKAREEISYKNQKRQREIVQWRRKHPKQTEEETEH